MKNKTKILLGVGALALIYFLYKRKKSVAQQTQEPQVGVSQGEGVKDKASLFNLFTRTRYTNPTKTPKPRPQTLTQDQIWQLNQPKVPKFAQTPKEQTPQKVRGNHAGIAQQQENVNKIQ